jgi:hypothetical protein
MWRSGQSASSASRRISAWVHPRESPLSPSTPGYEASLLFSVLLPLVFSFLDSVFIRKGRVFQDDFWAGKIHGSINSPQADFLRLKKMRKFRNGGFGGKFRGRNWRIRG